jgi:hypothetical protein
MILTPELKQARGLETGTQLEFVGFASLFHSLSWVCSPSDSAGSPVPGERISGSRGYSAWPQFASESRC